jgi:hypothetical protein
MDAAIIVAVIALLGSIVSASISLYGQSSATRRAQRREAEAILARYREPMVVAAFELQSRLFNICGTSFLGH